MCTCTRLVVGLGNGVVGQGTRHSVGLSFVEQLAARNGAEWALYPTLFAYVAHVPGTGVALVWPLVLYNLSGLAAGRAARRFSVAAADVWLVHDDIDLPVGAVRHAAATKSGGGNRGGLSSGLFLVCRSTCL